MLELHSDSGPVILGGSNAIEILLLLLDRASPGDRSRS